MKQEKFHFDHELNLVSVENVGAEKFSKCDPISPTSSFLTAESSKPKVNSHLVNAPSSLLSEAATQAFASYLYTVPITNSPSPSQDATPTGAKTMTSTTELRSCLTASPKDRKNAPIITGLVDYFPNAVAAIAALSLQGNKQHYPEGTPLHWNWTVSGDHADTIGRHLVDRGTYDVDGVLHSCKVAWRALALLETELVDRGAIPGRARRIILCTKT